MTVSEATNAAGGLLQQARLWIRKSATALDGEIQQTIAAGLLDLQESGVQRLNSDDPLVQQALKLYLKAQFGFSDGSEKFEAAYERLKASMSLSSDYRGEISDG